jgi:DNA-binding NarL/FixJ family response regulator
MAESTAPTGPEGRIRLLVVDDQPLIRRGLAVMLATEPGIDVVGQAADGGEAIEAARRDRPDVVLMDLQMPRVGGVAATRVISNELPGTQVVVLTTFDTDELVFDAIRAGAQAYLLKDAPESEVIDTIRAVHRGESRLSPNIARKVMEQFRLLPVRDRGPAPAGTPPPKEEGPANLDAGGAHPGADRRGQEQQGDRAHRFPRRGDGQELRQPDHGEAARAHPHAARRQGTPGEVTHLFPRPAGHRRKKVTIGTPPREGP